MSLDQYGCILGEGRQKASLYDLYFSHVFCCYQDHRAMLYHWYQYAHEYQLFRDLKPAQIAIFLLYQQLLVLL